MNKQNNKAIAALVIGILGLIAWILPILGYPVTIVGIIMGSMGAKSEKRNISIAGIVLSVIGLLCTLGNSAYGIFLVLNELM
ncbi:MAG: hypothetical protein K2F60_03145 [Oscillospiraceae bacterium]|nr:hypothetical protein [Oscillospiraceae bacterium]